MGGREGVFVSSSFAAKAEALATELAARTACNVAALSEALTGFCEDVFVAFVRADRASTLGAVVRAVIENGLNLAVKQLLMAIGHLFKFPRRWLLYRQHQTQPLLE